MRFRKNPSTGKLESNTNIYRWDDGSTTISIGDQHYELQSKPLAPPRDSKTYSETQDSHFYLASPSIASQLLLLVGHMSNQHTVRPNEAVEDDALEKLQKSLAAAARRGNKNEKGPELIASTQDPELQKRRAEIAEKERMRAQRRRETAAEKASLSHRPGGRGGLSLDDLEGRAGRRAPASGRKPPKPRKRRPEYDSDDDDGPKGRSREDEYDMEDDFLAPSDDEEEAPADDDEDEEELLDEESDREAHKAKKQKTSRHEDVSDADADAEADLDDEEAPAAPVVAEAAGRNRKRNVIEDDDDE
jgi:RNA polymerase-associated protein LEO1